MVDITGNITWNKLNRWAKHRRKELVDDLIASDDQGVSNVIRGRIQTFDEIINIREDQEIDFLISEANPDTSGIY